MPIPVRDANNAVVQLQSTTSDGEQIPHHIAIPQDTVVQAAVDGTGLDVTPYASAVLTLALGWGRGIVEASWDDGTTWHAHPVRSLYSGHDSARLYVRGQYWVDLTGVTHLRYVVGKTLNAPNALTGAFSVTRSAPPQPAETGTVKRFAPTPPQIVSPTILQLDRLVCDLDLATGTVYAFAGPNLYKSADYGENWSAITKPWGDNDRVNFFRKLPSGRLLAVVGIDDPAVVRAYLSDASETDLTMVNEYAVPGGYNQGFGISVYDDVIAYGHYTGAAAPRETDSYLWLSRDGGATWAAAYTLDRSIRHFHDVVFDPYANRVWFCAGDGYPQALVGWSDDWGATWHLLWEPGTSPAQFTTIHPTPDAVYFGTDHGINQGLYRHVRRNSVDDADPALDAFVIWKDGAEGVACRGSQWWEMGAIYSTVIEGHFLTHLNASKDGHNWYTLWRMRDAAVQTTLKPGLYATFGVDTNGNIVGTYANNDGWYLWKAAAPSWDEV